MSCAEPCHQDFHFPFHGKSVGNKVASTIAAAYESLGFSSLADTFGAWYVSRTPSTNVITDETPNRKDRTELATTGTVFDGSNYFEKTDIDDAVLATDNTAFTVRVVFEGQAGLDSNAHIIHAFDGSPDEGFRIGIVSDDLMFSIKDEANTTVSAETGISSATIVSAGVYEVVGTYDPVAELISVYVNGSLVNTKLATSFKGPEQNRIRIGCRSDTDTHKWDGNIYEAQIWNDQALTAAEIVKLHDKEISYFQNDKAPSVAWLLDGPTCTDLIGDNDLTPQADPAAYVGSEGSTWLNDQGYNVANNLNPYSEELNFGYTLSRVSIVQNDIDSPFGSETADKVIPDTDDNSHTVRMVGYADATEYTVSFWAKAGELQHLGFRLGSSAAVLCGINLADGTTYDVGSNISSVATTDAGDGWWKVDITGISSGTTFFFWLNGEGGDADSFYAGDGVSGLYIWGVHLVYGGTPPTYYKTRATTYDNVIVPKQWDSDTDTNSVAALNANSFGPCKRNREYRNGPAIDLNGTDQYGVKPNTHDYSGEDWTFRIQVHPDAVGGDYRILTQEDVSTNIWICLKSSGEWATHQDNAWRAWNGITNPIAGKSYLIEMDKVGTSHTITIINLTDNLAPETQTLSFDRASTTGDFVIGANRTQTNNFFNGKVWDFSIDCTSNPTKSIRPPISEESGVISHDTLNPTLPITWQGDPTWDFTANDSYFHGEAVGYSSVPIFVDPVELMTNGNFDMDGIKTASIEIDFLTRSKTNTFYTQGSVSPFRIGFSTSGFNFAYRDDANTVQSATIPMTYETDVLYRLKFDLVEDETNPTTASYATVSDRITGEVYGTVTGLNFAASTATPNSGPAQIGSYANATSSVDADIYRVRSVLGGVEKLLWTSDNHLVNQANDSAMTESGGTLEIKKIPAASKALDANGYPTTNPAGAYHNRTQAEVTETPVANSDSVNPIYYGASFDGTLDANINADTAITGYPFSIECDIRFTGTGGTEQPLYVSFGTGNYFGIVKLSGGGVRVQRRATITANTDTDFDFLAATWHSIKVDYLSATSLSVTFDGQTELHTGETSVPFPALTMDDLWVGQFRSTLGESPDFDIKNVVVKQGSTVVNDLPLYSDPLDRSENCNHGTLSATGVSFLSNVMETDLNPDIAESETRAVTSGDRKIISIGTR